MPIAEDKALEILSELIKKPETKSEDIPRIWAEIIAVYNNQFAPPPEPPQKKRRRRPANPNIGWPAGVKREEYNAWKAGQSARGVTENLNPQEYKRQRDAGSIPAEPAPRDPRIIQKTPPPGQISPGVKKGPIRKVPKGK